MYDHAFIFEECGFGWIPPSINRDLLFNVSYEARTAEIKLYILDESGTFLHKISRGGITRQYDAGAIGADPSRLWSLLGARFDEHQIVLDTIEGDTCYVYIEEASSSQYLKFLEHICRRYNIPMRSFVGAVNRLNRRPIGNIDDCMRQRAISLVRLPKFGDACKLYSRPFKMGNSFELGPENRRFLKRLYRCEDQHLAGFLTHMWVSTEICTERVLITTQRHELVHSTVPDARGSIWGGNIAYLMRLQSAGVTFRTQTREDAF